MGLVNRLLGMDRLGALGKLALIGWLGLTTLGGAKLGNDLSEKLYDYRVSKAHTLPYTNYERQALLDRLKRDYQNGKPDIFLLGLGGLIGLSVGTLVRKVGFEAWDFECHQLPAPPNYSKPSGWGWDSEDT